jgi:hypothetical protein
MMVRLTATDAADRQLIENSGGSVEVALGTEGTERELGDQLHVASDPASSASVAGGNAHYDFAASRL